MLTVCILQSLPRRPALRPDARLGPSWPSMLRLDVPDTSLLMLALLDSRAREVKWPALDGSRCLTTELVEDGFFLATLGAREAFCRAPAWAVSSKSGSTWTLQLPLRMMYMQSPSSPACTQSRWIDLHKLVFGKILNPVALLTLTGLDCQAAGRKQSKLQ